MNQFIPTLKKCKKDQVLFLAGSNNRDLYIVKSGQFLVCVNKGTQVTPLNIIGPKQYIGEFSFFDGDPRSAHIICLEDAEVVHIPHQECLRQFPSWLQEIARSFTHKIRKSSQLIRERGIRKTKVNSMPALSIAEQTHYYKIIEEYRPRKPKRAL